MTDCFLFLFSLEVLLVVFHQSQNLSQGDLLAAVSNRVILSQWLWLGETAYELGLGGNSLGDNLSMSLNVSVY